VDTGLLAHLAGATVDRLRMDPSQAGPLLENFVAMELVKQASWSRHRPEVFHFRTHSGQEVDVVLEAADGRVIGIEVKAAATVGTGDFRGLQALREAAGKRFLRGIILYQGNETVPFGKDQWAVPIDALWT
jgi:predicted AAA+ superfamily ATPase